MRKPSERKSFPHLEDLLAVHFVPEERVACGVCWCTVRRRERLCSPYSVYVISCVFALPHLSRDVIVKVARILRIPQFRVIRCGNSVNILPVDAAEPWMRLQSDTVIRGLSSGVWSRRNLP